MTRRRQRLFFLLFGVFALAAALFLVLAALGEGIDYYSSPSDLSGKMIDPARRLRLGGLVMEGSVQRDGVSLRFAVTDGAAVIPVHYEGIVPSMFRENQGVIADGRMTSEGTFIASSILAKHDENYVPRELVKTLEGKDHWFGEKHGAGEGRSSLP